MIRHPFNKNTDLTEVVLRELAIARKGIIAENVKCLDFLSKYEVELTGSLLYQIDDAGAEFTFSDVDVVLYFSHDAFPITGFIDYANSKLPNWSIEELTMSLYSESGNIPFVHSVVRFVYQNCQIDVQVMRKSVQSTKQMADSITCDLNLHSISNTKNDFRNMYNKLLMRLGNKQNRQIVNCPFD